MFARICRSEDEETVVMESQASTNCANLIAPRGWIDFPQIHDRPDRRRLAEQILCPPVMSAKKK
jgi:hypothetical protein